MEEINNGNIHALVDSYVKGNRRRLPPIGTWDVSRVTNMYELFKGCFKFNENINNWDVRNVTVMVGIFHGMKKFNQPLNNWNISRVTNMKNMFTDCEEFDQTLNDWDTSNVVSMDSTFKNCMLFNQPLNNWNVSNVTNMNNMFDGCSELNQNISRWNVSNVTRMNRMFAYCQEFNLDFLNSWDIRNVKYMVDIFLNAGGINGSGILPRWRSKLNPNVSLDEETAEEYGVHYRDGITNESEDIDASSNARQAQINLQKQITEQVVQQALNTPIVENAQYDTCYVCDELEDNIHGPGPSTHCSNHCNDVIKICDNNHKLHRGCILSMCNTTSHYTQSRLYGEIFQNEHTINTKCPECRGKFIVPCADFADPTLAPKLSNDELLKQSGGKRRKFRRRRTYRKRKSIRHRRKRRTYRRK
jgi:surface protein